MKYFVGLVPPAGISNDILQIQTQFGNNRLEPHITIIQPVSLINEAQWLRAVKTIAQSFEPFKIELYATGMFGKGVLFIEAFSEKLSLLHMQLMNALKPFQHRLPQQEEHNPFHPHLTLGRRWCGFTSEGFLEMQALADAYLAAKPGFMVRFLRVYVKAKSNEPYKILHDFTLMTS